MDLAWISLFALIIVIIVSCTTTVNAGILAIVLAWLLGVYVAPLCGKTIGIKGVISGFPTELFLTLVGVTLLFAIAQRNGTLDQLAQRAVRSCRGNAGLIPIMFFALSLGLASIGPGNIAAAALIAPMAMPIADRAGIPPFLMTLMVAHGSVAGALSPIAPTGIIARDRMSDIGLEGHEWHTYFYNLMANALVAFVGYFLFGGWRLFRQRFTEIADQKTAIEPAADPTATRLGPTHERDNLLQRHHFLTVVAIGVLVVAVIASKLIFGRELSVGMAAFVAALLLILFRAGDEREAIQAMPWSVVIMVCGVTVLTSLLGETGGVKRMADLVAAVSNERTVPGVIALVAGLVSVYSSTSGVVLPAFLPMTPVLVDKLVGSNALAIASSINVGGHLVDVSPLSTIGAICVASASATIDRRLLFNKVLAWGLSMSVVGALICYLFFGRMPPSQ